MERNQLKHNKPMQMTVNRQMEGWDELTKLLPEYLPGCRKWEEWFWDVAYPAFETNMAEIYAKKNTESGV